MSDYGEKKYHINPDTGNANICRAVYNCKFNLSDNKHYDTKEEAVKASEERLEAEFMDVDKVNGVISKKLSSLDDDGRGPAHILEFIMKRVLEGGNYWSKEDRENLYYTEKILSVLDKDSPTDKDFEAADEFLKKMNPKDRHYYGNGSFLRISRNHSIIDVAQGYIAVKKSEMIEPPKNVPAREKNTAIMGLEEAQLANLRNYNKEQMGFRAIGNSAEDYFQQSIDRIVSGEDVSKRYADGTMSYLPKHDRAAFSMQTYGSLYLATVFPDNELKTAMDRVGLTGVTVTAFENGRENGNAYTVIQPDGSTRTFSVYEHRNTDSIIINGKENWQGVDEEIPYVADSKNAFFAEFGFDDRQRAAEALVFYMKSAQQGTLENDEDLAKKASRLDWNAILTKQIPAFGEWLKKEYPDAVEDHETKTSEDILKKLDFNIE